MTSIETCKCPHCEGSINRTDLVNSMPVRAVGAPEFRILLLVCPSCNKALGPVAIPR